MDFSRAIGIAQTGYDVWASKPENRRWVKLIDGTPIPNDLAVCIASEFRLVLALADAPSGVTAPDAELGPADD